MKATVLITVYNLAPYVEQALASALRQTHRDLDIVVVDDASTDGSVDILHRFRERITLLRNDSNQGVLRSTLAGLSRATGDVVCFLDGDDLWEDQKVERVVRQFEADASLDLVSHDYRFVDATGKVILEDDSSQLTPKRLAECDPDALSAAMAASILEYRGHVWLGSAWSIRRRAMDLQRFEAWVAALPDPRFVYQDHPLASFLTLTGNGRLGYLNNKLLRYRVHDANYSGAPSGPARARAIVKKGLATHRATRDLVETFGKGRLRELEVQDQKIRELEFLDALYARELAEAVRLYFHCARSGWPARNSAKEAFRLLAVLALGLRGFLALRRQVV